MCTYSICDIVFLGDVIEFLSWMLNSLHLSLNGTKKSDSSIIHKAFRGKMRSYTHKVMPVDAVSSKKFTDVYFSETYGLRMKKKEPVC